MLLLVNHILCLSEDGDVYVWGRGNHCLGMGDEVQNLLHPSRLKFPDKIMSIASTSRNCFAIPSCGKYCYVWGSDAALLGNEASESTSVPQQLQFPETVTLIRGGFNHAATLFDDGSLLMWGSNGSGECIPNDDRTILRSPSPSCVGSTLTSVQLGHSFTTATTADGKILSWGLNDHGQLGLGHSDIAQGINLVTQLPRETPPSIDVGKSCGIFGVAGSFYSWGQNHTGQLGLGHKGAVLVPQINTFSMLTHHTKKIPILCHYSLYNDVSTLILQDVLVPDFSSFLLGNLERVFNNPGYSDIEIVVEEKKIYTSKVYLDSPYILILI